MLTICHLLQVTLETLWLKLGIKEAIDHRRLHHQLLPPYITVEKGFPQVFIHNYIFVLIDGKNKQ